MCFAGAGSLVQAGGSAIGGSLSALAAVSQAEYDQKVAERNAKIFKIQAGQALQRGELDAAQIGREFAQLVGRQRATFASQGFDVSAGDPVRLTEATLEVGRQEQFLAQYNAQLDAWAATEAAVGAIQAGELAKFRAQQSKISGIVGGATGGLVSIGGAASNINFANIGRSTSFRSTTTRLPATGGPRAGGIGNIA